MTPRRQTLAIVNLICLIGFAKGRQDTHALWLFQLEKRVIAREAQDYVLKNNSK